MVPKGGLEKLISLLFISRGNSRIAGGSSTFCFSHRAHWITATLTVGHSMGTKELLTHYWILNLYSERAR
jgi:hypothetical protein